MVFLRPTWVQLGGLPCSCGTLRKIKNFFAEVCNNLDAICVYINKGGIYGVNGCLPQIFAQQGCPVLRGTAAQYAAAKEIAETMPEYPKAGYIKEMETFIIVHFGEG